MNVIPQLRQGIHGSSLTWCITKAVKFTSRVGQKDRELFHTSEYKTYGKLHCNRAAFHSTSSCRRQSVAIVGSGPAGFYTAQKLLKGNPDVVVDIYEKLPVPFGLVRFGVAPDHPEVKNVINSFTTTANKDRCNFFGNVEIGKDLSLNDLRNAYTAVVLCYGAAEDRTLGIPGEDLPNVLSARSFVGWYNGLPEDAKLHVNLDCEAAVVMGHGNVALDVARILLTPISILEKTDISEHALEALRKSRVKQVHLIGRRGPLQVAFTIKELREMVNLPDTKTVIKTSDVDGLDKRIQDLPRPRRRLTDLIYKSAASPTDKQIEAWKNASREWRLMFLRSPLQILQDEQGEVKGIELAVNRLEGDTPESQRAVATDEREVINCGLILRSIGYRGLPLNDPVPFNAKRGVIDNEKSRVKNEQGLYCAGWIGHGPTGVILDTMTDGFDTGNAILSDIKSGVLGQKDEGKRETLLRSLESKAVTFTNWEKIDKAETEAGEKIGKPREKIVDIQQMIKVASA